MTNLTPSEARRLIDKLHHNQTKEHGISILEEKYLAALEIALPVLEGRIASSALPKDVFDRLYDQYLMGVICGKGNKSAAKDFMDACVVALYDCQPQPSTTPQIDNDGWIEWGGGERPVDSDALVEVKFRAVDCMLALDAWEFNWNHYGNASDIIAYRVIENDGREG